MSNTYFPSPLGIYFLLIALVYSLYSRNFKKGTILQLPPDTHVCPYCGKDFPQLLAHVGDCSEVKAYNQDDRACIKEFLDGVEHLEKKQYSEAIGPLRKALECGPSSYHDRWFFMTYLMLGYSLEENVEWDEALESYQEAVRREPKDFLSLSLLGLLTFKLGKLTKAKEMFEKIMVLEPQAYAIAARLDELKDKFAH